MKLNRKFALFVFAGLFGLTLLIGATSSARASQRAGTFVGPLEGQIDLIGIEVSQADSKNRRIVRAYLCDGEPGGDARWYTGVIKGNKVRLTSTDGETTLEVKLGHDVATGSLIFADGSVRGFTAPRAIGGGGIWDIEVRANGTLQGISLAGDTVIGTKSLEIVSDIGDGRPWQVTVTTVAGETFQYLYHDTSTMTVEELQYLGLPTTYATGGLQPDSYTAVWLVGDVPSVPSAVKFGLGRSANVRQGQPGSNIFGIYDPSF